MKLNYSLFLVGIILITIGLWDYFYLRGLDDISNSEESQQLVPSIFGAILLVFSPLFQKNISKWSIGVLCLFLFLTAVIFLSSIFKKPYADTSFMVRHICGLLVIFLAIVTIIKKIRTNNSLQNT
jgi:uncharacterized membrane protein